MEIEAARVVERERGFRLSMRFVLVFGLFLLSTVAFLDRTNISIAGVAISGEYGLDKIQLGWVFSAFLLGYAGFQIPGGWLAVRFGPRRVLTWAVLWWGAFTALTTAVPVGATSTLVLLILVRFGLGIGESVVYPAANQFVARWIPVQERGRANGWIFAGVGAGSGLSPPLLTAVIADHGWRASFWLCAALGVVVGAVWYVFARDRPDQHPRVRPAELAHIHAGIPRASASSHAPVPWRQIASSKQVWALTLSYFTFGYVVWIFFSWFFIYLAEVRGLNLKTSALYTTLPFLAMTVCCLFGGVLSDWISRRFGSRSGRCGLAAASLLLTAVFLVCGSMAQSPVVAVIVLAGGAGAIYLSQSSFWSVSADIAGPHAGVVSGTMNMGCQIGGAITASLTPWIAAHFGWTAAFVAAAVLAVLGALAWVFVDATRPLVLPAASS